MTRFSIEVRRVDLGAEVLLRVVGDVDVSVAADLLEAIVTAASVANAEAVRLDLSEVGFIDSSGVAALVRAHRSLSERSTKVTLAGSSPAVDHVLAITGVDELIDDRPGHQRQRAGGAVAASTRQPSVAGQA
jgi:anti-sigma B factor antagonist